MTSPSNDVVPMTWHEFFATADELDYRVIRYSGRYLLAAVKPEHAERFPGCRSQSYQPAPYSNPSRQLVEIVWTGE